jgi:histidine triad (HIT) family protein
MPTIFSRIITGEIPCHRVWEDAAHFAFLDINPWTEGHTLVVPKKEHEYLVDMPQAVYLALHAAAQNVAKLLKQKLGCKRVVSFVVGYEQPHVLIHLLPTNPIGDFLPPGSRGMNPKPDFAALLRKILS